MCYRQRNILVQYEKPKNVSIYYDFDLDQMNVERPVLKNSAGFLK